MHKPNYRSLPKLELVPDLKCMLFIIILSAHKEVSTGNGTCCNTDMLDYIKFGSFNSALFWIFMHWQQTNNFKEENKLLDKKLW